jgi:DNA polymerase-3 subunit epsilon
VSSELSLFGGDASPEESVQPVPAEAPIADWLVNDIRTALTTRGLTTMAERQQAIEAIAERPVESIRSLTRAEALRVLSSLASTTAPQASGGSAWDDRDEDTWIDRL